MSRPIYENLALIFVSLGAIFYLMGFLLPAFIDNIPLMFGLLSLGTLFFGLFLLAIHVNGKELEKYAKAHPTKWPAPPNVSTGNLNNPNSPTEERKVIDEDANRRAADAILEGLKR